MSPRQTLAVERGGEQLGQLPITGKPLLAPPNRSRELPSLS